MAALFAITDLQRAEDHFARGRIQDALQAVSSLTETESNARLKEYINLKAGFHYLFATDFDRAGASFAIACATGTDPRLVIRLFPDLRLSEWTDERMVARTFAGVEASANECGRGIFALVMDNLYKNYSPHIKPEQETMHLQDQLQSSARQMIRFILIGWTHHAIQRDPDVCKAVYTSLAILHAEADAFDDYYAALDSGHVSLTDLSRYLRVEGRDVLLADVYRRSGRTEEVLRLWTRSA